MLSRTLVEFAVPLIKQRKRLSYSQACAHLGLAVQALGRHGRGSVVALHTGSCWHPLSVFKLNGGSNL